MILHVKPSVTVGDEVGERLGSYLRSGFFNFWTDPHIHMEIRDPNNALRVGVAIKFIESYPHFVWQKDRDRKEDFWRHGHS